MNVRAARFAVFAAATLAAVRVGGVENGNMSARASFGSAMMERLLADSRVSTAVVSPPSVESVLAVLASGAEGHTRQALNPSLARFGIDPSRRSVTEPTERMVLATALWKRPSISIKHDFEERMRGSHTLTVHDFATTAPAEAVNRWASEATAGRIPRVVDDVPPSMLVLIAGAAYFKARWATPFSPSNTRPAPFTSRDGSSKQVPTMSLLTALAYRKANRFSAVTVRYEGGTEVMEFVLPIETGAANEALRDALSMPALGTMGQVRLSVPRFAVGLDVDISPLLEHLGFASLFEPAADFGAITSGPLVADRIRHAAYLRVDEDGTEAAAVTTAVMIGAAPAKPPDFELALNRPFFAIVRSATDGLPLFIAYVAKM